MKKSCFNTQDLRLKRLWKNGESGEFRPDQFDEFIAGGHTFKSSGKIRGSGDRVLFLDTPHLHAEMMGFDDHGHTQGFQRILDALLDLRGKPFLHLKPPGVNIHHPRNLAQSGDIPVGNVSHVRLADKREQMVFSHGINLDILDNYHLPVILFEHGGFEDVDGIHFISLKQELHGFGNPVRRFDKSFAVGVFPKQREDLFIVESDFCQFCRIVTVYSLITAVIVV